MNNSILKLHLKGHLVCGVLEEMGGLSSKIKFFLTTAKNFFVFQLIIKDKIISECVKGNADTIVVSNRLIEISKKMFLKLKS